MKNIRKILFFAARTVIGFGLAVGLVYLTLRSTETDLWEELLRSAKLLIAVSTLLFGSILTLSTWRWQKLLRVQGIELGFMPTLRLTMIGHFFNLAIPGAVGGDLVKMAYISRQTPGKRTESIFSIVADRIMGMLGLFIVASAAVLFSLRFLVSLGPEQRPIQIAAFTVGLGSAAGAFGLVAVEYHQKLLSLTWVRKLFDFFEPKVPNRLTEVAQRVVTALDTYRRNRKVMLQVISLSVAVHCLLALNLFLVGKSLHEDATSLGSYFLTAQVANAIAAIPITPAGVGPRDYVAKSFFEQMGMNPEKIGAIPVTLTLIIIFWGLVGAVVFVMLPGSSSAELTHQAMEPGDHEANDRPAQPE